MKNRLSTTVRLSSTAASQPVWLAVALALLTVATSALAQRNSNPDIAPPNSTPYGHTYGEWGALWWRWALSIPTDNPVADTTGQFAATGQAGPVWFLAGSFGATVTRTVQVPAGKGLFFPPSITYGSAPASAIPALSPIFCH